MKIQTVSISNAASIEDLRKHVSSSMSSVTQAVNGNLNFKDNIASAMVQVTFPDANVQISVGHKLGFVPSGYSVIRSSSPGLVVHDGTTPWNTSYIFVAANQAGAVTLLIF